MPRLSLVFVVGLNDRYLNDLLEESDEHEDLVITNHMDTYQNLTLKTLAAFDWLRTFCPQAEYLLKTDDDMFIQVFTYMILFFQMSFAVIKCRHFQTKGHLKAFQEKLDFEGLFFSLSDKWIMYGKANPLLLLSDNPWLVAFLLNTNDFPILG